MNADPYSTLGLAWGASRESINRAFREFALLYHPDRNAGDAKAEARFKLISAAYQRLKESDWKLPPPTAPAAHGRGSERSAPGPEGTNPDEAPPAAASDAPSNKETEREAPMPRPHFWSDGRPIHYPTQAEIDSLLRDIDRATLLPRLRLVSDWTSKVMAYALFIGTVALLLWIVALVLARRLASW